MSSALVAENLRAGADVYRALMVLAEFMTGDQYRCMTALTEGDRTVIEGSTCTRYNRLRQVLGLFGDMPLAEAAVEIRRALGIARVDGSAFKQAIEAMQTEVHATAVEKGWWDTPPELATLLLLIHAEVSEVAEADRRHSPSSDKIPGFSSVEEELADVVIRCFDLAEGKGLRLAEAIEAKARFNKSRPIRHGGKRY